MDPLTLKTRLMSLMIVTSLLFAACSASSTQPSAETAIPPVIADASIIAEGRVEPIQFAQIAFTTSGVISEVLVQEGEAVTRGQPLIRLGNASDTNYAAAQLELVTAQQAMDELLRSRDKDLAQAAIELEEAQEAFIKAEHYLKYLRFDEYIPQTIYSSKLISTGNGWKYRYEARNIKGPAPKEWIEDAERDLALKKAELEEAQRVYDRFEQGPDAEQLPLLEARLSAAEAKVAAFSVIAPFDGVVAELNARAGNSINAGAIAVTVADFSSWLIETTDLTEIDVVALSEDSPVTVTLDAIPGVTLNGEIESIGQTYEEKQGNILYSITVALSDSHPRLRWGMTAMVTFEE